MSRSCLIRIDAIGKEKGRNRTSYLKHFLAATAVAAAAYSPLCNVLDGHSVHLLITTTGFDVLIDYATL